MTELDWSPLDAVIERMDRRLRDFDAAHDHRAIFLTVYRSMTGQMREHLPAGRFLDPRWTLSLTTRFAGMYFEADEAFEQADAYCPAPWECAFTAAGARRVLALEHAMLGINAHITYDLPRAVAGTMREFGDTAPDGPLPLEAVLARRRYDYEVVNDILAHTTDPVQELLARRFAPVVRLLDAVALRFDEYVAEMFLRYARTQGWNHAVALAFAQTPDEEELIRRQLEHVSLELVGRIDVTANLPRGLQRAVGRVRAPLRPAPPPLV